MQGHQHVDSITDLLYLTNRSLLAGAHRIGGARLLVVNGKIHYVPDIKRTGIRGAWINQYMFAGASL